MKRDQIFEIIEFDSLTSDSVDFGNDEKKDVVVVLDKILKIFDILKCGKSHVFIKNFPVQTSFYLNFMSLFGNPVPQDPKGTIIGEVSHNANTTGGTIKRGHKSNKKLNFHNDRCDLIGLLCSSRAEIGGLTILVEAQDIYKKIKRTRPDLLKVLESKFAFDLRDDQRGDEKWYEMPIFMHKKDQLIVRYIRKFIESAQKIPGVPRISSLQNEALNYLDATLDNKEFHTIFSLEEGDLLLINNFTSLHSRTAFTDTNEFKRLLFRIWLSNPKLIELPDSFKLLFGSDLDSGIRGGIRLNSHDC